MKVYKTLPTHHSHLVDDVLQERRCALYHIEQLGLKPLGLGLKLLFWVLRIYVLSMLILVVIHGLAVFG